MSYQIYWEEDNHLKIFKRKGFGIYDLINAFSISQYKLYLMSSMLKESSKLNNKTLILTSLLQEHYLVV